MDALELLKQDHQKVKGLFAAIKETDDRKEQKQLFKETKLSLKPTRALKRQFSIRPCNNTKN